MALTVWTIGHSTRTLDEFLQLLRNYDIEEIADVRSFPGSRKYPHFGQEALAAALQKEGVAYEWFKALGGRRRPSPDSPNIAWRNASFRGYADYMAHILGERHETMHPMTGPARIVDGRLTYLT